MWKLFYEALLISSRLWITSVFKLIYTEPALKTVIHRTDWFISNVGNFLQISFPPKENMIWYDTSASMSLSWPFSIPHHTTVKPLMGWSLAKPGSSCLTLTSYTLISTLEKLLNILSELAYQSVFKKLNMPIMNTSANYWLTTFVSVFVLDRVTSCHSNLFCTLRREYDRTWIHVLLLNSLLSII